MRLLRVRKPNIGLLTIMTCFLLLPVFLLAQESRTISGRVTDSAGTSLQGVSVAVQKSKAATVTDANGNYAIKAKAGDVLLFSSISYSEQQITVADASNYDVVMKASVAALGDVVVVGYGQSSRRNLSSAVTTVKPGDLNKGAISDVGQMLQGKVPGLNITASGDPNKPAAVVLRGPSTINSPQGPFYVIDGIPGADIAAIAPDDIASIDVLKDAAATAIYGNKASNGVIMVTTKKGRAGVPQTVLQRICRAGAG